MRVFDDKVKHIGSVLVLAGTLTACGGNNSTSNTTEPSTLKSSENSANTVSVEQSASSTSPENRVAAEGITNMTDQHEVSNPATTNPPPVGKWLLQNVTQEDGSFSLKDSQQTYTLELSSDGKATGSVACNRWHGTASFGHLNNGLGTLQLDVTGTSRKRCMFKEEHEQKLEYRYLKQLKAPATYAVANNSLTLTLSNQEVWTYIKSPAE